MNTTQTFTAGTSGVEFLTLGTAFWAVLCASHHWTMESLRGSNRNRRVETVRCTTCGHRERRIWVGPWNRRRPDKVRALNNEQQQSNRGPR